MLDWPGKKPLHRNSVAADQQLAFRLERFGKRGEAGLRMTGAAAFHLDRSQAAARAHDKVHLRAGGQAWWREDGRKPFTIYSMY